MTDTDLSPDDLFSDDTPTDPVARPTVRRRTSVPLPAEVATGASVIEMRPADLLVSTGFANGRLFDEVVPQLCYARNIAPEKVNAGNVLVEVIETLLVPALDQQVHTVRVSSGTNPVRAVLIDGIDIRDGRAEGVADAITPEIVTVELDKIGDVVVAQARRGLIDPPRIPADVDPGKRSIVDGLSAWVGRRCQIVVEGVTEPVNGVLAVVNDDSVVIRKREGAPLHWIPRSRVCTITSLEISAREHKHLPGRL